ncbi:hypothetical protein [Saccharopolyspora spinosa]|uniref:Uncharacterized protein n=1 Tax=Saccharopolyspora spinosa TaxID=60894 RepID=A0A2N3Y6K4_SACSN|nr:hypothetical protein [Saccharopolyspora spinosa]PKW18540.1 hypothetical protein A8926_6634 [Saccharopolyspora spinosa]
MRSVAQRKAHDNPKVRSASIFVQGSSHPTSIRRLAVPDAANGLPETEANEMQAAALDLIKLATNSWHAYATVTTVQLGPPDLIADRALSPGTAW